MLHQTYIAGNRYVTIPSDLRFIRYVQLKDSSGNQVFLEKKIQVIWQNFMNTPSTAIWFSKYYANWDANFWVVAPTPDSTYEITLAYIQNSQQQLTSGSAATSGTYLSNKYQDLLLYGCLVEAYGYLKGPSRYVTILHAGLSKSFANVRDRTTRS